MGYDEVLADRLRDALAERTDVVEKAMFGGLTFMVRGHMCVGVIGSDLCARVGKAAWPTLVEAPGARPMDFTGRPMKTMVYVAPGVLESDDDLGTWVGRCLAFVESLPPK